jgi:hypothetical protein
MKPSSIVIWIFEALVVSYCAVASWFGKITEWTFLLICLAIILAVWDNKRVKITKDGLEVDDEETNNGTKT